MTNVELMPVTPETVRPDAEKTLRERVLDWCNARRIEQGLAPVDALCRGKMGCVHHCVIARTARLDFVEPGGVIPRFRIGNEQWLLPGFVSLFATNFDAGDYPDLIDQVSA